MKSCFLFLFAALQCAYSADIQDNLPAIRASSRGIVAFCRTSAVDELQIIGEPHTLTETEAKEIGILFGSLETYFAKNKAGKIIGGHSRTFSPWDFKILLTDSDFNCVTTIRLCSDSREIALTIDDKQIESPNIRSEALAVLVKKFEVWFPGWIEISAKERAKWEILNRRQP